MGIRESISAFGRKPVEKEVEGVKVFIRRMSLGEADSINAPDQPNVAKQSTSVRLLARFLGDENGVPVFDLSKPDDVKALEAIPAVIAARLLELGNAVNVPPKDEDAKKT